MTSWTSIIFNGGLKQVGSFLRTYRNNDLYGIQDYDDLVPLLGKKWYIRGINEQLDFCAVLKDTVVFHLYCKAPIKDFITRELLCGGYMLVFRFVRFDGVRRHLQDFI